MALEDFEKQLAEDRAVKERADGQKRKRSRSPAEKRDKHRHHHHRSRRHEDDKEHDRHRKHRSSRHYEEDSRQEARHRRKRHRSRSHSPTQETASSILDGSATSTLDARHKEDEEQPQRMSWMETPSSMEVQHVPSRRPKTPPGYFCKADPVDQPSEAQEDQLHHQANSVEDKSAQHDVDYKFGDAGSEWRMKKLRGVYREAEESGKSPEDIAIQRYGDLRTFDDAREEETEVDRHKRYGAGYVGKEKPSGDLYQERKLDAGIRRQDTLEKESSQNEHEAAQAQSMKEKPPPAETVPLDQSALNKLKAAAMRAKLRKAPEAAELEAKFNEALAQAANKKEPDVVVLNKMENRMLAGSRKGEVHAVDTKRGRERGLVEENEDMSIEDMVRQERRTKGQFGGDGRAFAERITKDGKFNDDLDYMDDNAERLAKSVQKTDLNLRNTAIGDFQKMKRILDKCPLCTHEDTGVPSQAPVVSLATRTYLTLPTAPEITPYGYCASIVPTQHRLNLLECDDDEWEEIRNFMKSLTRFYYSLKPKRSVIFYENAAHEGRKRHASMEAVPLPLSVAETIPQYFKESILSADEEWTQHKKIIDTLKKSEQAGFGKQAFRKSMVSELPYFHVWFRLDGGLGHVVEDSRRWPKGDLFAREIIGGILDVGPERIKKQGRWRQGDPEMQQRVQAFRKGWEQWDWTKVLIDAQ